MFIISLSSEYVAVFVEQAIQFLVDVKPDFMFDLDIEIDLDRFFGGRKLDGRITAGEGGEQNDEENYRFHGCTGLLNNLESSLPYVAFPG
jgi:hypothetical protein